MKDPSTKKIEYRIWFYLFVHLNIRVSCIDYYEGGQEFEGMHISIYCLLDFVSRSIKFRKVCLVGNQHSQKSATRKTGEKVALESILNK